MFFAIHVLTLCISFKNAPPVKDSQPTKKVEQKAPDETQKVDDTSPPESIFKNLKPSEHRYSLRDRDEL